MIRFDYYGTGDSYGEYQHLDFHQGVSTLKEVCDFSLNFLKVTPVVLIGIRLGANVILEFQKTNKIIENTILIDPIYSGGRYLKELKLRRRAFYKLNNMSIEDDYVILEDVSYLDHQGFLISPTLEDQLSNINLLDIENLPSKNKYFIFSLDHLLKKKHKAFADFLTKENIVEYINNNTKPFWNSLEKINTEEFQNSIITYV